MKLHKLAPKKNVAQAMVEFAIVLPILLLLLYGLLEVGRLLFMYSTVVTASRQASRYGASTGAGIGDVPRYRDCDGIRLAANRVDYLNAFDHTEAGGDIDIEYDDGIDPGTGDPIVVPGSDSACEGPSDPGVVPSPNNTTRVVVTVRGHFTPLVPLVPLGARTIEATSARTILMSVTIVVPPPGAAGTEFGTGAGGGSATGSAPNPSEPGQTVAFTATVVNSDGGDTPTGTVDISIGGTVQCTITLVNGTGSCNLIFSTTGNYDVTATYEPDSEDFESTSTTWTHTVTLSNTVTTIADTPDPSVQGNPVNIHVIVTNVFGGTVPTGTVDVTTDAGNCTITLDPSGEGNCSVTYSSLGTTLIEAEYNGDTSHLPSDVTGSHEVLTGTATPSQTSPPPTFTFTVPPPTATFTLTPAATPVTGCSNIQPSGTITISAKTMYLNIYNPMMYNVTVSDVFVVWNYPEGANGHPLTLKSAQMNSTLGNNVFWTGNVEAQSFSPPLSTTVMIPANSTSRILFTFDKMYTTFDGEQIQIRFSTPGCQDHTINVVRP